MSNFRFKDAIAHYQLIDRHLNPGFCNEYFGCMKPIQRVLLFSTVAFVVIFIFSIMFIHFYMSDLDTHHTNMEDRRWYKNATFYEIFPASFKDTDSDGYGDFEVSLFNSVRKRFPFQNCFLFC